MEPADLPADSIEKRIFEIAWQQDGLFSLPQAASVAPHLQPDQLLSRPRRALFSKVELAPILRDVAYGVVDSQSNKTARDRAWRRFQLYAINYPGANYQNEWQILLTNGLAPRDLPSGIKAAISHHRAAAIHGFGDANTAGFAVTIDGPLSDLPDQPTDLVTLFEGKFADGDVVEMKSAEALPKGLPVTSRVRTAIDLLAWEIEQAEQSLGDFQRFPSETPRPLSSYLANSAQFVAFILKSQGEGSPEHSELTSRLAPFGARFENMPLDNGIAVLSKLVRIAGEISTGEVLTRNATDGLGSPATA